MKSTVGLKQIRKDYKNLVLPNTIKLHEGDSPGMKTRVWCRDGEGDKCSRERGK